MKLSSEQQAKWSLTCMYSYTLDVFSKVDLANVTYSSGKTLLLISSGIGIHQHTTSQHLKGNHTQRGMCTVSQMDLTLQVLQVSNMMLRAFHCHGQLWSSGLEVIRNCDTSVNIFTSHPFFDEVPKNIQIKKNNTLDIFLSSLNNLLKMLLDNVSLLFKRNYNNKLGPKSLKAENVDQLVSWTL